MIIKNMDEDIDKMGSFDVDQFHEVDENPTAWKMRRNFLETHWKKFPQDRLICLSKCFVNIEIDGCRYPDPVMRQIAELRKELPEVVKELKENKKRKYSVNFVKASYSQETDTYHVDSELPGPSTMDPVQLNSFKDQKKMSYGFVKSDTEYKSTNISENSDVSSSYSSSFGLEHSKKMKSENFKTALYNYQQTVQSRQEEQTEERIGMLGKTVKLLQNPNKNAIEIIYLALAKVPMSIEINNNVVEEGTCFECVLNIDCVEIAREKGLNKKAAKHNTFKEANKKLMMKYHRVVSLKLESSDIPFPNSFNEELISESDVSYESNEKQLPKRNRNFTNRQEASLNSLSKFLLMQPVDASNAGSVQILRQSADFNKSLLSYYFYRDTGGVKCCVAINESPVVECLGDTKQVAKLKASDMALEFLREQCWTVCLKQSVDSDQAGLSKDEVLGDIQKRSEKIPESNVGNKMLRKMGWSGGGVGKDGTGIADPVAVEQVINREGLGLQAEKGISADVKSKLESLILNYARSNREDDLVFAPDFTKEERAILHQYSQKLGLLTRSYGKGDSRYLTVRRKRSADQLFKHIMNHGGSTSKYDLFPPGTITVDCC